MGEETRGRGECADGGRGRQESWSPDDFRDDVRSLALHSSSVTASGSDESPSSLAVVAPRPQGGVSPMPRTSRGNAVDVFAGEFLIRLNRAVQRATIYPSHHPSIRRSLGPLLDAASDLFARVGTIGLLVGREHITLSLGEGDASIELVPWLSSRLSERGIAALRFDGDLDEERALGLVTWLAGPGGAEPDAAPPAIDGIEIQLADYSAIPFVEDTEAATGAGAEHDVAWRRMVAGLRAGGVLGDSARRSVARDADDPEHLAAEIEAYVAAHEGTGASGIVAQIVSAGEFAATLSGPARLDAQARLARLLVLLPAEVKAQLLRVAPGVAETRLRFLETVMDHLPMPDLLDVLQAVQLTPGRGSMPLVAFLMKLGAAANARGAEATEAYTRVLSRAGLASDVVPQGHDALRAALETMLFKPLDDGSVPEEYRRQLDSLGEGSATSEAGFDRTRYAGPEAHGQVARQAAFIATQLILDEPTASENSALLARAAAAMPAALADGDFACLARTVDASCAGSPADEGSEAWSEVTSRVLAFAAHPDTVARALSALDDAPADRAAHLARLLRAGGFPAAEALLRKITEAQAADQHEPLVALLATFDVPVLKQLFSAARERLGTHPDVLVALLCQRGLSAAHELAEPFTSDANAEVRLQAYRVMLNAGPNPTKLERLVGAALDDPEIRVVELAVSELRSKAPIHSARPLGQFLRHRTSPTLERAQRLAVQTLLAAGAPLGRDQLVAALAHRRQAWDAPARHVSLLICRALERIGDATALRAARRWRRSPAGVLSTVLRDRVV